MLNSIKSFFGFAPVTPVETIETVGETLGISPSMLEDVPVYFEPPLAVVTEDSGKTVPEAAPDVPAKPTHKFEVFPDAAGNFRWRLKAIQNGQTVATSGEAYLTKLKAKRAAKRLADLFMTTPEIIETEK